MSTLGLPSIEVTFKQLAASLINRSAKGVVCLIIHDDTNKTFDIKAYNDIAQVLEDEALYTAGNYNAVYDAFLGSPLKVIVCRIDVADALSVALAHIQYQAFNYLALIDSTVADHNALVVWVKSQNLNRYKRIKVVTYKATVTDDEHVLNLTNDTVTRGSEEDAIAGHLYLGRLAGIFAGLPATQSGTYYKLTDLKAVSEVADIGASIGAGNLVITNKEGTILIARAVNTLQTIGSNGKTDDWKFIATVETMDMMYEDIKTTFQNDFVGKYKNNSSNQTLWISSNNGYFRDLAREQVLDDGYNNVATINTAAMKAAWEALGKDMTGKTEEEIRKLTIGTDVYTEGDVKILNAIEGLKFAIGMF